MRRDVSRCCVLMYNVFMSIVGVGSIGKIPRRYFVVC
jgi:hypothetical protein